VLTGKDFNILTDCILYDNIKLKYVIMNKSTIEEANNIFKCDEFGFDHREFELEMIKFSLLRLHPHKTMEEIERAAIDELKDIYQD
jgi:hypothetical protein